jgi:hypothetical protein
MNSIYLPDIQRHTGSFRYSVFIPTPIYIAILKRPKMKLSFLLLSLLTSLVSAASPTYYGMHPSLFLDPSSSFDSKLKLIISIKQSRSTVSRQGNSIPVAQEHRRSRPTVLASLSRIKWPLAAQRPSLRQAFSIFFWRSRWMLARRNCSLLWWT